MECPKCGEEIDIPPPGQPWPDACANCGLGIELEAEFTGDHWRASATPKGNAGRGSVAFVGALAACSLVCVIALNSRVTELRRQVSDLGVGQRGSSMPVAPGTGLSLLEPVRTTDAQSSGEVLGSVSMHSARDGEPTDSHCLPSGSGGLSSSYDTLQARLDPDAAPTRERFMDRAGIILCALERPHSDVAQLPESFWQVNHDFRWILSKSWTTLGDVLPQSIEAELSRQWGEPDTQALWAKHQELWRAQETLERLKEMAGGTANEMLTQDLELVHARLDSVREALWSESPQLLFLWRAERALRE